MDVLSITYKKKRYFNFLLYGVPPNGTWTTDKEECSFTYENVSYCFYSCYSNKIN